MTKPIWQQLQTELLRWRGFQECLLVDMHLVRFGFGVELVFNYVWDDGVRIRNNVLEQPILVSLQLLGVRSLRLAGGLTDSMIAEPELIDWGLSEVAIVKLVGTSEGKLSLSVQWEGDRQIDVEFVDFEICQRVAADT